MRLMAVDHSYVCPHALMCTGHLHQSGFAHEHSTRAWQTGPKLGDRLERTTASDFFVIAQKNMDRPRQARVLEFGNHRKADCVKPFHITGSASIKAAVLATQF